MMIDRKIKHKCKLNIRKLSFKTAHMWGNLCNYHTSRKSLKKLDYHDRVARKKIMENKFNQN